MSSSAPGAICTLQARSSWCCMLLLATICAFLDLHMRPSLSQQTKIASIKLDMSDGKSAELEADFNMLFWCRYACLDFGIALPSAQLIQCMQAKRNKLITCMHEATSRAADGLQQLQAAQCTQQYEATYQEPGLQPLHTLPVLMITHASTMIRFHQ